MTQASPADSLPAGDALEAREAAGIMRVQQTKPVASVSAKKDCWHHARATSADASSLDDRLGEAGLMRARQAAT